MHYEARLFITTYNLTRVWQFSGGIQTHEIR